MDIVAALEGGSGVSVDSDHHANVTGQDGSGGTNQVGGSSVGEVSGEVSFISGFGHLLPVDGQAEDDGDEAGEDKEVKIFFVQEGARSLS
jgi:hypothetical protein